MKITTEICKRELDQRFPAELGVNKGGWKRLSRKGSAKTSIVRIFQHRQLAVWATVVEQDGEITSVDYSTEAPVSYHENSHGSEAAEPVQSGEPARNEFHSAADFYFAVVGHYEPGYVMVVVCPVDFWERNKHTSDSVTEGRLQGLLPKGFGESMEGCFEARASKSSARRQFLAKGFQENAEFSSYCESCFDF